MTAEHSFHPCNSVPASTAGINDLFLQNTAISALLEINASYNSSSFSFLLNTNQLALWQYFAIVSSSPLVFIYISNTKTPWLFQSPAQLL